MPGGKYNRKSIRLKDYDYNQAGMYFITICVKNRECLFGKIVGGEMALNELGEIVEKCWQEIITRYPKVELDEFIIMPNHLHGIIFIVDDCADNVGAIHELGVGAIHELGVGAIHELGVGAIHELPLQESRIYRRKMLLPKIIGFFKMNSAKYVNQKLNYQGTSIWQRNYYEHIIRNEKSLENIRNYICNNPGNWPNDIENSPADKNIFESHRINYYKNVIR